MRNGFNSNVRGCLTEKQVVRDKKIVIAKIPYKVSSDTKNANFQMNIIWKVIAAVNGERDPLVGFSFRDMSNFRKVKQIILFIIHIPYFNLCHNFIAY